LTPTFYRPIFPNFLNMRITLSFCFSSPSTIFSKFSKSFLFFDTLSWAISSYILTLPFCFSLLQRGNTRMDAAVDAMRSYGFSEELVKETVRELLNVGLFLCFPLWSHCFFGSKNTYGSGFCVDCNVGIGLGLWWGWWMGLYWRIFLLTSSWLHSCTTGGKYLVLVFYILDFFCRYY
jgi:hypothetical protein